MPNWIFAAVPFSLCLIAYLLTCMIESIKEQRYLHTVFDGDRVQKWKEDRRQARLAARNIKRIAARNGGVFIGGNKPKRNRIWISDYAFTSTKATPMWKKGR